jgi:hypothetical protein
MRALSNAGLPGFSMIGQTFVKHAIRPTALQFIFEAIMRLVRGANTPIFNSAWD